MKKIFMLLVCAAAVIAFAGAGICADTNKSKDSKMSMIDKMKKAYSDFRNKGKAKKYQAASPSIAKKEPLKAKEIPPPAPAKKEFTKEEMLEDIKDDLEAHEEIIVSISGLKAEKDNEDKVIYTFNNVKIEEMSGEDLQPLFKKVRQFAIKLNTERIQRQMETVERAQVVGNVARGGATTPSKPPTPPQTPKISSVPSGPPSPPSPPRTFSSPPSASQRR